MGPFTDYHFDGVKLMTGVYAQGKKEGLFSNWFHNGQLESEGNFLSGKQTGTWTYFYPDGRDRQQVLFDDKGFRIMRFYDSTGRQLVLDGTGHWYEFYEEYNIEGIVSNAGDFVDGKKQGTWTTAYNGDALIIEKFKDDKFIKGFEIVDGKRLPTLREILNKLLPHYKFAITEKWKMDNEPLTAGYYSNLFPEKEKKVFLVVEEPASFTGGMRAMFDFISKNLTYPAQARKMGVEGSVFVSFIVDKDGSIHDITIVKGISEDCDREAKRLVSIFPNWTPGRQNGKAVRSKFILPIKFSLGRFGKH
jgi:TonB family protein